MPQQATASVDAGALSSPEVEARILREQVDSMMRTSRSAAIGAFFIGLGFWTFAWYQTGHRGALLWAVLLHGCQFWRYAGYQRYLRTPDAARHPRQAGIDYSNALVVNATIWGLAPWMFLPDDEPLVSALMMLVILGMSTGSIASLAPHRRALLSFPIPAILGLSSRMFWQGDAAHLFMGAAALIYLYVNLAFGLQQHRLLTEALRSRYEKEALARRLREQIDIAERASAERTRFFAAASHDLRQPLHSLGLFGSALATRLRGGPEEALARNLMSCVTALESSFNEMLDVSRLDAGVVQARMRPVALVDVFRALDRSFAAEAEGRGLALRLRARRHWVRTDPQLLERLLGNLVHNALKFTVRGGVVVGARRRGGQVSIEVWDSGRGIEAAELPRVFEEFYQVGNRERDRAQGLGMGLAIVRRLAALLQLQVEVDSRPGRGTVFRVLAPAALPVAESASLPLTPPRPWPMLQSVRVLVIDDEEAVRASTAAVLRTAGVEVHLADGAATATDIACRLEAEEGARIDVVVCDFRLRNDEDGVSVVAGLRAALRRAVPAVLITGDTAPDRVQQARYSGLPVLYKPVPAELLLHTLGDLLDTARPVREVMHPDASGL
ncbi:MAG: hybrid sensor histidine kinase/response regulator [Thauera sp.]|nr:MAG: hybrid sensor histidine kinase/response regulator [Thauera sp.]